MLRQALTLAILGPLLAACSKTDRGLSGAGIGAAAGAATSAVTGSGP